jgi:proline dehydrogenase
MSVLRSAFIALSRNPLLRRCGEKSRIGSKLSSRFVAGTEIEDALRVAESVNKQGMHVTLDSLGESVATEAEVLAAADIYHRLLDAIAERKLDANISVKLTQMGLALDPELAESIAVSLTARCAAPLESSFSPISSARRTTSKSCWTTASACASAKAPTRSRRR